MLQRSTNLEPSHTPERTKEADKQKKTKMKKGKQMLALSTINTGKNTKKTLFL